MKTLLILLLTLCATLAQTTQRIGSATVTGTLSLATGASLTAPSGTTVTLSAATVNLPGDVTRLGSSINLATSVTGLLPGVNMAIFTGDTGSGGAKGAVPAPAAGDNALNKFLRANGTWATVPGSTGADEFIQLNDAPTSYTGQAGKTVKVNSGETALEFATLGEVNTASSLGSGADGEEVFAGKTGVNLTFRRLLAGDGIAIAPLTNSVLIESAFGTAIDLASEVSGTLPGANMAAFTGDSGSGGVKGAVPAPASGDAAAAKFLSAAGTWATTPSTVATFTQLTDVPADYTGEGGKYVAVNTGGSALEFVDAPPSTSPTTTHGDLIVRGASADARLPIGTEGQILTVENAATNKVAWKTSTLIDPDLAPVTPNAYDEEFASGLTNTWTWANQGTVSASVSGGNLNIDNTSTSTTAVFRSYGFPTPTGDWTCTLKFFGGHDVPTNNEAGFFLGNGTELCYTGLSNVWAGAWGRMTNATTFGTGVGGVAGRASYMKIVFASGVATSSFSGNGIDYYPGTAITPATTVNRIGFYVYGANNTRKVFLRIPYMRFTQP